MLKALQNTIRSPGVKNIVIATLVMRVISYIASQATQLLFESELFLKRQQIKFNLGGSDIINVGDSLILMGDLNKIQKFREKFVMINEPTQSTQYILKR